MSVFHLLIKTGIRTVDHINSRNRKDVKMTHGMRKFYVGQLVNSNLHETIIRKLSGHSDSSNLTQLYSKQTVEEMLEFYMTAIDNLTINPENRLMRRVEKLEVEKTQFDRLAAQIARLEAATFRDSK